MNPSLRAAASCSCPRAMRRPELAGVRAAVACRRSANIPDVEASVGFDARCGPGLGLMLGLGFPHRGCRRAGVLECGGSAKSGRM
jgi:hypothetical protein